TPRPRRGAGGFSHEEFCEGQEAECLETDRKRYRFLFSSWPGFVPGIHVFYRPCKQYVDGRVKPGHDDLRQSSSLLRSRTDCMIGSKFCRASSASNNCAVSSSKPCERAIAIRTSFCGVSDSRPWPDSSICGLGPLSRSR